MKDLYSILNISKNANGDEIKKSYRKLAFQCHPDKNKASTAQTQFQEISEAYDILSNPQKRSTYDRFGYETVQGMNEIPINPLDLFQSLFNVDFGSLNQNVFFFSDLSPFGFMGDPPHTMIYMLELTLEELYTGTQKEFVINHKNESGIYKETKYVLNIKPGTQDKEHLSVKGGGDYNPHLQTNENLIIKIKELSHPIYNRQGNDLYKEHTISLCDALCGPQIITDHFGETLHIDIQHIVKPNSLYQVLGKGMPIKRGTTHELVPASDTECGDCGNLILDLKLEFPEYISEKRKGYLRQILGSEVLAPEEPCTVLQAYYFKDKEDVMKDYLQEEEEDRGCLQQ